MNDNEIGGIIVDRAVRLYMAFGPGLLETIYEVLLAHGIQEAGLAVRRQVTIPIEFEGITFDEGLRADLIVEDKVIVEPMSVERVSRAHQKQVLTYLKLTGMKLGFLLIFGEALVKGGIHRVINGTME